MQLWIMFVGSRSYKINFISTQDMFDSTENIEILDHFIKSIKFLGGNNASQNNQTSRFNKKVLELIICEPHIEEHMGIVHQNKNR